jgi:hypothetical protein
MKTLEMRAIYDKMYKRRYDDKWGAKQKRDGNGIRQIYSAYDGCISGNGFCRDFNFYKT